MSRDRSEMSRIQFLSATSASVLSAGRTSCRPHRLQPRSSGAVVHLRPLSAGIEPSRVRNLRPETFHRGGRSRIGLRDRLPASIYECQHVYSLKHPRVMAWGEVHSVQQIRKRRVHVDARRSLRLIGREAVPVSFAIPALVSDHQRICALDPCDPIYSLKNVLEANLLGRKLHRVVLARLSVFESRFTHRTKDDVNVLADDCVHHLVEETDSGASAKRAPVVLPVEHRMSVNLCSFRDAEVHTRLQHDRVQSVSDRFRGLGASDERSESMEVTLIRLIDEGKKHGDESAILPGVSGRSTESASLFENWPEAVRDDATGSSLGAEFQRRG